MVKKQTGFQIASYVYPEDYLANGGSKYGRMRSEVESLQNVGWEVLDVQYGSVIQGEGTANNYNILVTLVKYEYVPEPVEVVTEAKAVGRPKKDA